MEETDSRSWQWVAENTTGPSIMLTSDQEEAVVGDWEKARAMSVQLQEAEERGDNKSMETIMIQISPAQKGHTSQFHRCEISTIGKFTATESR